MKTANRTFDGEVVEKYEHVIYDKRHFDVWYFKRKRGYRDRRVAVRRYTTNEGGTTRYFLLRKGEIIDSILSTSFNDVI